MTREPDRRPEAEADGAFLFVLFASAHGLPLAGLDPPLRDLLLRQGFAGQRATYRARYPAARFEVIAQDGASIGRIVTDLGADAVTLVDIVLLPEWRGRGLGTRLIDETMAAARLAGLPLRLAVSADNAGARRLYARLGFATVRAGDLHHDLAWTPPGAGDS
ncbi:GNAT family N-acetyltransferase [Methylobacterium sp. J-078]|uniref:GNAT family N-acetyltransferase n=1 Tax=Methylobacterium sp. J-078 TaxID=2836657 RepID=UPI001FBB8DAB|nr:GNAT family N-acetyltransferase [Methylobacterium sp. J-078]MCJ2045487.1 GNAT family N-acetyltransferase [Methylobacterium sp. J-078]